MRGGLGLSAPLLGCLPMGHVASAQGFSLGGVGAAAPASSLAKPDSGVGPWEGDGVICAERSLPQRPLLCVQAKSSLKARSESLFRVPSQVLRRS